MFPTDLWPPLELVEATLEGNHALAASASRLPLRSGENRVSAPGFSTDKNVQAAYLLLPMTELAKRRAAVAIKAFSREWASGRLVQMTVNGAVLGVLLDRLVQGRQWSGWCAASESNWASEFDVLLEPKDEPFEPMFGVIQAWNPVTVDCSDDLQARIVCEISAMRLAAIRAVALECASGLKVATPVEPGRIALRTAGGGFSVLTGTPLGPRDVRYNYQNAYRTATARLIAQQLTQRVSQVQKKAAAPQKNIWTHTRQWFAADWVIRPAFALMAMFMVAQNTGLLSSLVPSGFHFRSIPGATATATATANLRVQWKAGVRMDDVQQLLKATSTEIVGGPDARSFYSLKSSNVMAARTALSQSALVEQVLAP